MNFESIRIIEELLPDLNAGSVSQHKVKKLRGSNSAPFQSHLRPARFVAKRRDGSATDAHALAQFVCTDVMPHVMQ